MALFLDITSFLGLFNNFFALFSHVNIIILSHKKVFFLNKILDYKNIGKSLSKKDRKTLCDVNFLLYSTNQEDPELIYRYSDDFTI